MTSAPILLELKTVSEPNVRGHWAKKAARVKAQRNRARAEALAAAQAVGLPVVVTLTRIAPSSGLDDDNLRGALKAVRDGIADALQVDDRDPRVTWRYDQQRGAEYGVMVEMEAAQ